MALSATAPLWGTVRPRRSARGTASAVPEPRTTAWQCRSPHPGESFRLPAVPRSVPVARARARRVLCAWQVPDEPRENALLVLSELATNVIAHPRSDAFVCVLRDTEDKLAVEVVDQHRGPRMPEARVARPGDEHGRGLALVAALSTAWGRGPVVWIPAGPRPLASLPQTPSGRCPQAALPNRASTSPSLAAGRCPHPYELRSGALPYMGVPPRPPRAWGSQTTQPDPRRPKRQPLPDAPETRGQAVWAILPRCA
ncbi:ATP-binding protein [Streptomyces litchfieldiae]|uniref:ATP-binding protein n=1 Tax=Streptomyces litchfieldiae TaxID=3075543 RepID=UPI00374E1119